MRIKCISCEALARMVYACAADSPHIVDISLLQIGLHDKPADLRQKLQAEIDQVDANVYQAITLAYGLCGKALEGISTKHLSLIIPRAHDCITLFLGSRTRYQEQFSECPGTYWFALDYLERSGRDGSIISLGSTLPIDAQAGYDEYVKKYGKDNADYLMDVMGSWQKHYSRAVFIQFGIGDENEQEQKTLHLAEKNAWHFEQMEGSLDLIRRLLHAEWDEDFLTLKPGEKISMSSDAQVMTPLAD